MNIKTQFVLRCLPLALVISITTGCRKPEVIHAAEVTSVQAVTVQALNQTQKDTDGIRYTGSIVPNRQVDLSFRQGGYVEEILQVRSADGSLRTVQEGDFVRAGTRLARLRPEDYRTHVAQTQAQLAQVRTGIAEAEATLSQTQATEQQAIGGLQEAQASQEASVAELTNARAAITLSGTQVAEARIGRETAVAQRDEAQAALTRAIQDFERAEALYKTESLTRADYDAARAARDAAQARFRQADASVQAAENRIGQAQQQEIQAKSQTAQAVAQISVRRSQVQQARARITASQGARQAAQAQVETARAAVQVASTQVEAARIPLSETVLCAPFDGIVLKRAVELGTLTGPGSPAALTLASVAPVKVVFGVPDTQVKTIQLGQQVPVRVETVDSSPQTGRITAISPAADEQTRLFRVEVSLPNTQHRLRVGMIATLDLSAAGGRTANARSARGDVLIPPTALLPAEQGYAIFVVSTQGETATVQRRTVSLGAVYGNQVAVRGIQPGEQVVTMGAATLKDGQTVRVVAGANTTEDSDGA